MVFQPSLTEEELNRAEELYEKHGSMKEAAKAAGLKYSTFKDRLYAKWYGPKRQRGQRLRTNKRTPQRHFIVPDTQVRPNVPLDHLEWVAKAIAEYRPNVLVHIGDHWDFPSLNSHEDPGSEFMENQRYTEDVDVGNRAFKTLFSGVGKLRKQPRKVFLFGNHEDRADRFASSNPKFRHLVSTRDCDTLDFERHKFGEIVEIDGVLYSHFFSHPHSGRAIGGQPQNRLNKVCQSFVQGHVQGFDYGTKITPTGDTLHGVVAGSCYLHREEYRGAHQRHWRGVVVLNEVADGNFCVMPLSLDYLCRKYEAKSLFDYMRANYPDQNWEHLS